MGHTCEILGGLLPYSVSQGTPTLVLIYGNIMKLSWNLMLLITLAVAKRVAMRKLLRASCGWSNEHNFRRWLLASKIENISGYGMCIVDCSAYRIVQLRSHSFMQIMLKCLQRCQGHLSPCGSLFADKFFFNCSKIYFTLVVLGAEVYEEWLFGPFRPVVRTYLEKRKNFLKQNDLPFVEWQSIGSFRYNGDYRALYTSIACFVQTRGSLFASSSRSLIFVVTILASYPQERKSKEAHSYCAVLDDLNVSVKKPEVLLHVVSRMVSLNESYREAIVQMNQSYLSKLSNVGSAESKTLAPRSHDRTEAFI
ncbi:unnamed protein product [Ilex paraguariensis]|uniref:PI4-kinase N-terminal domain-containing protein n=1 Tax=Ilex paraguariensis TaxID=185542 RepID=A0ABC8R967_9AQUA